MMCHPFAPLVQGRRTSFWNNRPKSARSSEGHITDRYYKNHLVLSVRQVSSVTLLL